MGEPSRQYQPVDLLEFKRRLQARFDGSPAVEEDPLAELARIVGGEGHVIPAPYDVRAADPAGGLSGDHPAIETGPIHDWQANDEIRFEPNADVFAPTGDYTPRLRHRRNWKGPLLMTTGAVVVASLLALLVVKPNAPSTPTADTGSQVAVIEAPDSPVAAPVNDAAVPPAQPQPAAAPLLKTVSDDAAAAPAAAAPADSPAAPADMMIIQPRQVRTIPINGDGTLAAVVSGAPASPAARPQMPAPAPNPPRFAAAPPVPAAGPAPAAALPQPAAAAAPSGDSIDQPKPSRTNVASVAPARASSPATPAAASDSSYAAILASPTDEADARTLVTSLTKKYARQLGSHRLTYHRVKVDGKIVYQVRATGLTTDGDAQALCAKLSDTGASCQVGLK